MTTRPHGWSRWSAGLALLVVACGQPQGSGDAAKASEREPEVQTPVQAPPSKADEPPTGWSASLKVAGVGRLSQGDEPPQEVLDQRRAAVEAALAPMSRCLQGSSAAQAAKPKQFELHFGTDAESRPRVFVLLPTLRDEELFACLRETLGDTVAPTPDERVAVDVAVLVEIEP